MRFYTGTALPERYRNAISIAEHVRGTASGKTGYRVSVVRLQSNRAVSLRTLHLRLAEGRVGLGFGLPTCW